MDTKTKRTAVICQLALTLLAALPALLLADENFVEYRLTDREATRDPVQEFFTDSASRGSVVKLVATVSNETPAKKSGRYCLPGYLRAGWPHCIASWARPAVSADYEVGYVGGGTLLFGENRCRHEGTFGLDYSGWLQSRKTWLKWSHGLRYQGGEGAYTSDGPKLVE